MFRVGEIKQAVGGELLWGNPQSIIRGVCLDSRAIKPGQLFVALRGRHFDGHDFIRDALKAGARAIIFSRRCRLRPAGFIRGSSKKVSFISVSDTRIALGNLARAHRQRFDIPIVAITGSNGKTTTKDMLAWILSSGAKILKNPGTQNNDIGVPLTLLKLNNSHNIAVLELGTNHFGEIAYLANMVRPNLGIITNIGPAHLEFLKDLRGVYKEKSDLLSRLDVPGIAILNADEARLQKLQNKKKLLVITYGIKNKADFHASGIKLTRQKTIEFTVDSTGISRNRDCHRVMELNTVGLVNVYNALAGITASRLLGWDYEIIRRRLKTFVFPQGRLKIIKLNGITFIDDTYNSNPASLSEALTMLSKFRVEGRRVLVMGDMLELGRSAKEFHSQAGSQIARVCDAFIGVGRFARLAGLRAIKLGLSKDCVFNCSNSRQAGNLLFKNLEPDNRDLILVKGSRLMKMEEALTQRG